MSSARRFALTLAATAALAVAGCGTDTADNNDYAKDVSGVTSSLLAGVGSIPTQGGSPQKVSAALNQLAAEYGMAATELDGIEPPDEVADLHRQIVADLKMLEDEAKNAADEVAAGGAASAAGVVAQLEAEAKRTAREIESTLDQISGELGD